MALRLDPHDPFEGLVDARLERAMHGRWCVYAVFHTHQQAAAAQSRLLVRP